MTMDDTQDAHGTHGTHECQAIYFDGATSRRREVTLRLGSVLDLVEDGAVAASWPLDTIRRVDSPPDRLRLRSTAAPPLARVETGDVAMTALLVARCPALDAGRGGPAQTGRIIGWSLAAACSIVGLVIYGIPFAADRLAPLVPRAVEQRIGDAVDVQFRALFGARVCDRSDGQAALASLAEKIRIAGGITHPLDAHVLAEKTQNAVALPGGRIYLFDGLLQRAQSADEVAGILAHELGHVHHLHVMRSLIHNGGTSFLVGLLFGDVVGAGAVIFATRSLLGASHSRESEQEADAFAFEVMRRLGRSPVPMAQLLLRITGEEGKQLGGFTILNSHPLTEDRLAAARKNDRPPSGPELLSPQEWRALKAICRTT
jgi:Zn-dependent protease with chaperone function